MENYSFTQKILSGKYGLLSLDDLVDPYDAKITTKADVKRVQNKCLYRLVELHKTYDAIIVVLGKKYREVISPILDSKCLVVFKKKGLFAYYTLFAQYNQKPTDHMLKELEKFRIAECYHFKVEGNAPHTCYFCSFRGEKKCQWSFEFPLFTPTQQKTTSEEEL